AEDGIRDRTVTGVQTCALPILAGLRPIDAAAAAGLGDVLRDTANGGSRPLCAGGRSGAAVCRLCRQHGDAAVDDFLSSATWRLEIGRASCRERVESAWCEGWL